jgi:STAS-like domain of unknown function (DUF4325)
MVIEVLKITNSCYNHLDGLKLFNVLLKAMPAEKTIVVDFSGVDSTPSSFINSALIGLLDHFSFDQIKEKISFINTTPQINEMIKSRFLYEVATKKSP